MVDTDRRVASARGRVRRLIEAFANGERGAIACPPAVSTLPRRIGTDSL